MGAIFPRPAWAFVKNATNVEQQRAAERRRKKHEARVKAACKSVIATREGRFWITQILIECGIDDEVSHEAARAQFDLGRRSIGLSVLAHVRSVAPDLLVQLIRDHQAEVGLIETETHASQTPSATAGGDDAEERE